MRFQVEVYGADGINYAEKKNGGSARQSSQHFPKSWPRRLPEAECVIDGDRCEGFNHTAPQPSGWLEVSFAERAVEAFAIFNMLGEETCARADGLLVQLLDSSGRVVFQHRISAKEDAALFDPKLGCCQQWVKEDARVIANLSISHKGSDEVKVSAFQLSGAKLAEFTVSLSQPGAIWQMHRGRERRFLLDSFAWQDLVLAVISDAVHSFLRLARVTAALWAEVGSTPLLGAAQAGHAEVVRYLCGAKAKFEGHCADSETPLMAAVLRGHLEVVQALCEVKADPQRAGGCGTTPLFAAQMLGLEEIAAVLRESCRAKWRPRLGMQSCCRRAR
ncbi:unnamed protein product [Effrenium voratum]|nr:unnamed protein product [Effrenium voratum]